jgi:transposase
MNKAERLRQINLRTRLIKHTEESGNIAKTCRYFGISRKTYYKWIRRYEELGAAGLSDQSRAPLVSPNQTNPEIVEKVLYLRKSYHFGAGTIAMYLSRYHEISISSSTVHEILKKHGLSRLPKNNKKYSRRKLSWKRYEKQEPGHRVQVDVKFLQRIPGTQKRFYQYTAIDDCTRVRILKIYDKCNQKTSINFINEVIRRMPFKILVI